MFEFYADEMNYSTRLDKFMECVGPIGLCGNMLTIKKVIFNPPATIAFWADGTKTVVKCMAGDIYDPYAGLALCYSKKILGKKFHKTFRKHCESYYKEFGNEGATTTISFDADNEVYEWVINLVKDGNHDVKY